MFLIAEKVRKKEVPKVLTAAMVPPSLRGKVNITTTSDPPVDGAASTMATTSGTVGGPEASVTTWGGGSAGGGGFGNDFSAIQELDSITNEIHSIKK